MYKQTHGISKHVTLYKQYKHIETLSTDISLKAMFCLSMSNPV